MQAQCLYQPGEIPLNGIPAEDKYVDTTVAFVKSHLEFLLTDAIQRNPPFKRTTGDYSIEGLALPKRIAEKILFRNAERLIPGE
jgi:hypothetical protein